MYRLAEYNATWVIFSALGLPQLCGLMALPAEVKVIILLLLFTIGLGVVELCKEMWWVLQISGCLAGFKIWWLCLFLEIKFLCNNTAVRVCSIDRFIVLVTGTFQLMILGRLPVHCILNVSSTCQELRSLANDSTLWQHLVFRDFGESCKCTYSHTVGNVDRFYFDLGGFMCTSLAQSEINPWVLTPQHHPWLFK